MVAQPHIPADVARNIIDPLRYAAWKPVLEDFAWLRANMPLAVAEPAGYDPFWVVTKQADLQEVGRQPLIFENTPKRAMLISKKALKDALPQTRALTNMDAPEHGRFRMLTFGQFAPKGIASLTEAIRELARESIDEMAAAGGRCDFANDVALAYPLRVIMSLLGLPREDERLMMKFTQEVFNPQDPDLNKTGSVPDLAEANSIAPAALLDVIGYFNDLTDGRRANPTEDVASVIANGRVNGELLTHEETFGYYAAIMTAGHDTTSSSTSAGVWALAERPDLFGRIRADRSLIPALVTESIRWASPIYHFMRTATQDYEMRGQTIKAGDWLFLSYPSGNQDEDIFPDPEEFSIDRSPNNHISFGHGAHVCIGQHLAKLEMRIFFEEFFDRVEKIELAGEARRTQSNFVGGIKTVPVLFSLG